MNPDKAATLFRELLQTPDNEVGSYARRARLNHDPEHQDLLNARELLETLHQALEGGGKQNWERVKSAWTGMRQKHGAFQSALGPAKPTWVRDLPTKPSLTDFAPGTDAHQQQQQQQAQVQARFVPQAPPQGLPTSAPGYASAPAPAPQPAQPPPQPAQPQSIIHAERDWPGQEQAPPPPGMYGMAAQPAAPQPAAPQPAAPQPDPYPQPPAQPAASWAQTPPVPGGAAPAPAQPARPRQKRLPPPPPARRQAAAPPQQPAAQPGPQPTPAGAQPAAAQVEETAFQSVAKYAAFCAACAVFPDRAKETEAQYGIQGPGARGQLDDYWQDRFDDEPELQAYWEKLFGQFRASLSRQR